MKVIINNFFGNTINMWIILIVFLFLFSFILTFIIKFDNYKLDIKKLLKKDKTSLFLTLGTKIGVGVIIGTTSAIIIGGFSSVFWMILFSIITSSIIYMESFLGYKYKKKHKEENIGGPFFIFKYGVKSSVLAYISLFLLIITYCFLSQMIQMNTIAFMLKNIGINNIIILTISIIVLLITTFLSIKEILSVLNKIVPFMCAVFLVVCIYCIISNISLINVDLFLNELYSFKSFFSGLIIGVKRSLFVNEILMGTTSTSCACDKNDIKTSIKYQIVGVYFISIVITILIAFLLNIYLSNNIISSDYNFLISDIFTSLLGKTGNYFLLITYILFGFTTILSGYYIGKCNIEYVFNNSYINKLFKYSFVIIASLGTIFTSNFIWEYLDYFIFIMIILNSYSIIVLYRK